MGAQILKDLNLIVAQPAVYVTDGASTCTFMLYLRPFAPAFAPGDVLRVGPGP